MARVDRIAEQVPFTSAAASELAPASVMCLAGIRVAVTEVQGPAGSAAWQSAAGWVRLALGLLTLCAALAVEGSERRPVLLLARHSAGELQSAWRARWRPTTWRRVPGVRPQS